jgi:hypothetical protein
MQSPVMLPLSSSDVNQFISHSGAIMGFALACFSPRRSDKLALQTEAHPALFIADFYLRGWPKPFIKNSYV